MAEFNDLFSKNEGTRVSERAQVQDGVLVAEDRGMDYPPGPSDYNEAGMFQFPYKIIQQQAKSLSFPAYPKAILCSLLLSGLIILTCLASQHPHLPGDVSISQTLQSITFLPFEFAMYAVSVLGIKTIALTIVLLCVVAMWMLHHRLEAVFIALIPLGTLAHSLLNLLANRPVPSSALIQIREMSDWLGIAPGSNVHTLMFWGGTRTLSFPSGHVVHFTLLFGFLLYLVSTQRKPGFSRSALQALLIILILASGLSRIYLGMHWFSDILGSYLVSGLLLVGLIAVYTKCRQWLGVCPKES